MLGTKVTATGFRERRVDYDWTLSKRVKDIMSETPDGAMFMLPSTSEVEVPLQQVRWIEYEISAQRNQGSVRTMTGVRGEVCLTNSGNAATANLAVAIAVQAKSSGQYTDVTAAPVDVSSEPVLSIGETFCYPYEITFPSLTNAEYRTQAHVIISNAAGHSDQKYDSGGASTGGTTFTVPSVTTDGPAMDTEATVDDGGDVNHNSGTLRGPCAEIYYLWGCSTPDDLNPWHFSGSGRVSYVVDMQNNFSCGDSFDFTNTATLTEGSSGTHRSAHATLHITSSKCGPAKGCTLTLGYWKQPFHQWPDEMLWSWSHVRNIDFFDSGRNWQATLDAAPKGDAYLILAIST